MIATILTPGLSTAQDAGRAGFEEIGVPVAGAWHVGRYTGLGQLLGQDARRLPSIELVAGELRLGFEATTDCAVSGPARIWVDGHLAANDVTVTVPRGSELTVRSEDRGPVYVGVSGWEPERVLGSCSCDTFSRLGGRPFAAGDVLQGQPRLTARSGWFLRPEPSSHGPVRVVLGPGESGQEFCATDWVVTSTARSGTRMRTTRGSPPVETTDSIPVIPGAVQITPDGEAIILGVDGGLTGGYPVVGVVATADRDRVSTLGRGETVRFEAITPVAGRALFDARARAWAGRLVDPTRLG